jgi:hypothetical protein
MSNLQLLANASVGSNSMFYYKDHTGEYDHRIQHTHEYEKRYQIRHDILPHKIPHSVKKENDTDSNNTAFEKAKTEAVKLDEYVTTKYKIEQDKLKTIEGIVRKRNKSIKDNLIKEKMELQETLTRIIRDTLKFTKENTPMISMLPTKITNTLNKLEEHRRVGALNTSSNSMNVSRISNASVKSIQKYESCKFLQDLGLDIRNLNPNNIKIDIDKAYEFVHKWNISRNDLTHVIRMKLVNEIMNVEERRSVHRVKKLKDNIKKYEERLETYERNKKETEFSKESKSNNEINITDQSGQRRESININVNTYNARRVNTDGNIKSKKLTEPVLTTNSKESKRSVYINPKRKNKYPNTEAAPEKIVVNLSRPQSNSKSLSRSYGSIPFSTKGSTSMSLGRKKKVKINAYKNVQKLVRIINSNNSLLKNENVRKHFYNLYYNKKMDDLTNKLLVENRIETSD